MNQQAAHEIIALELLTVLLEKPTDDSVEVAVGFVTECGSILQDLSPKGLHGEYSLNLCGNNVLRFIFVNMLMNFPFVFFRKHGKAKYLIFGLRLPPSLLERGRLDYRVLRFKLHEIVLEF